MATKRERITEVVFVEKREVRRVFVEKREDAGAAVTAAAGVLRRQPTLARGVSLHAPMAGDSLQAIKEKFKAFITREVRLLPPPRPQPRGARLPLPKRYLPARL